MEWTPVDLALLHNVDVFQIESSVVAVERTAKGGFWRDTEHGKS